MKKFLLICFISFFLVSCGANKIDSSYYKLNENIDFKLLYLSNLKTIPYSRSQTYIAKKGYRYKQAQIKIRNNSEEKQEFDLGHLYLIDKYNRKHKFWSGVKLRQLQAGNSMYNSKKKLGGKKEGVYLIQFSPAFPKDEVITKIAIDTSDSETLSENARIISLVTE